jgi:uncharacterized membrane protein YkgB
MIKHHLIIGVEDHSHLERNLVSISPVFNLNRVIEGLLVECNINVAISFLLTIPEVVHVVLRAISIRIFCPD